MNQKLLNTLFITSIFILFFTTGYLVFKSNQQTLTGSENYSYIEDITIPTNNTDLRGKELITNNQDQHEDWITYVNNELGLSFKYPREYGEFKIEISNGDTGKIFRGGFPKFSNVWDNNNFFTIGGNTNDYAADRSIFFLDFINYSKESNKYFDNKAMGKKYQFEPVKELLIDGQTTLIVDGKSYLQDRMSELLIGPGTDGGALINLPHNQEFKGLAIWNSDVNKLSQKKFEEIISTFKFAR